LIYSQVYIYKSLKGTWECAPTWGTHLFQNVEQNMFKLVRYNQRQKTGTFYKYNLQLNLVLISYIYPQLIPIQKYTKLEKS
jgi:hypothetical protein